MENSRNFEAILDALGSVIATQKNDLWFVNTQLEAANKRVAELEKELALADQANHKLTDNIEQLINKYEKEAQKADQ